MLEHNHEPHRTAARPLPAGNRFRAGIVVTAKICRRRCHGLAYPSSARELALIVDDPDAPTPEPWVHWVIYKIPVTTEGLAEGVPPVAQPGFPPTALQGKNSWGSLGYRGPAPPKGHGVHRYFFKLYALGKELDRVEGLDKPGLLNGDERSHRGRG